MAALITNLLKREHLSLSDVARISGVAKSTLSSATKRPVETWTIKTLNAFAKGLNEEAGALLNFLQSRSYQLEINDHNQTIQGVQIADKELYQQIRFVVENNHLEGWQPTKEDIEYLVNVAVNPDPQLLKEYHQIFGVHHD